jgi:hypothetical protein
LFTYGKFILNYWSPFKGFCLCFSTSQISKCFMTILDLSFIKFLVFCLLCILQCKRQAHFLSAIDIQVFHNYIRFWFHKAFSFQFFVYIAVQNISKLSIYYAYYSEECISFLFCLYLGWFLELQFFVLCVYYNVKDKHIFGLP